MSRAQRLTLGIVTLVPLVYVIVVLVTPLRAVFTTDPMSSEAPEWFLYFTALHFFMYLYMGLLLAFYMLHLFGNKAISREVKALWAILLVFGSVLTMPLYWFIHVWRNRG
ncbi:hypothetical protein BCF55_0723 [Hydrogenivirga caldilitoris]|uniref:Phospholipase D-like protein n=1 Tax=Hydrogenivirga caldilitoris TaxID=246264 RepID=A0A497XNK4_9AQUI|nr:hypothetical protein [Hydrogenivirga caldilitoris]RLJ70448.1 hypothetical protein BCF55_0723 [Hydrogenivirga caldilitoris]